MMVPPKVCLPGRFTFVKNEEVYLTDKVIFSGLGYRSKLKQNASQNFPHLPLPKISASQQF